jgi:hypothetical protein
MFVILRRHGRRARKVDVGSFADASAAVRAFMLELDSPSRDCGRGTGDVFDRRTGEHVAYVSPNGRVWPPDNQLNAPCLYEPARCLAGVCR